MRLEAKYEGQKVANVQLTALACWILQHTAEGIERGRIAEGFFGLERRYCGWFTDPCFGPNKKRTYEQAYRHAQPRITKTLKRLEKLGLIHLIRERAYVKHVTLTEEGREIARQLKVGPKK